MSTKVENFKSNRSFCSFYSNLPKTSFVHKMSKFEAPYLKRAPLKYPKWKFASEINHFVILPKFTQNFLQFQNEQNHNYQNEQN